MIAAWRARDAAAAAAHFAEDGAFIGVDGVVTAGRDDLLAAFARFLASPRPWTFTRGRLRSLGEGAAEFVYRFTIADADGRIDERPGYARVRVGDGSLREWREAGATMSQDTLTIDLTTTEDGNTQVYVLHGSLDIATSPSLRAALLEAAERRGHGIIVDLTQLEFLDSTGLGALIGAHKRAIEFDGTVRLIAQEGQILRLLRITGLLDIFHVYPTIDAALADDERLVGL